VVKVDSMSFPALSNCSMEEALARLGKFVLDTGKVLMAVNEEVEELKAKVDELEARIMRAERQ